MYAHVTKTFTRKQFYKKIVNVINITGWSSHDCFYNSHIILIDTYIEHLKSSKRMLKYICITCMFYKLLKSLNPWPMEFEEGTEMPRFHENSFNSVLK